jgi:Bacteriophage tail sheath protein
MAEFVAPGVYVTEGGEPPRVIDGVSTSVAGFVGQTERGPFTAQLVSSWKEFEAWYGDFVDRPPANPVAKYLPYAVRGFFENGGQRLYIARVKPNAGLDEYRAGLAALALMDEISIVAIPDDAVIPDVAGALLKHCEEMKYRFAVLDSTDSQQSGDLSALRAPADSALGAFYLPWLRVPAPHTAAGDLLVPAAGHVAGIYARVDAGRGVHKAPANEPVLGLSEDGQPLARLITEREQDVLNANGVNVIRDFRTAGRGIMVWGARTMSADPEWRYVNVRRLFICLERSIDLGTKWVVFEPNSEPTWAAVRLSIQAFLLAEWRKGALLGGKPDEAFFVRCDRTTMTQADVDSGRLVCEIGVAPVRPAEFVIFRIGQWTRDATA